jgi:kynurenine formamidase
MRYIDLSYDIEDKMPVYPYDSEVVLQQDRLFDKDKYNNFRLDTGMHSGTHIDSPMHMTKDKTFIGDYVIDKFCGRAVVFDVTGRENIGLNEFDEMLLNSGDIVLFYTGFENCYGKDSYYTEHPVLDIKAAELLVQKKVKVIGFDMPSPDRYPFDVHKLMLKNGIFIAENLKNLGLLIGYKTVEIFMFPLKIKADASLVRAVAKVE